MNFGVFYQSGYNYNACYHALEQLRKIYPNIPIALFEDGSKDLELCAKEFDCEYKNIIAYKDATKLPKQCKHTNGWFANTYGRPFIGDITATYEWTSRIYECCLSTLNNVEWVILYEDDVWCNRRIKEFPQFDLSGDSGPIYTKELHSLLQTKTKYKCDRYGACGGTIFKRSCFLQCFENFWNIDWNNIQLLDDRIIYWCDAHLSFLFQYNGFSTGKWGEMHTRSPKSYFNKDTGNIDVAFLHGYKHYYMVKQ